jgi:hypothetical protein
MRRPGSIAAVFVVCAAAVAARQIPGTQLDLGTSAFESYIELLRQQAGIPGISGLLLQEGSAGSAWRTSRPGFARHRIPRFTLQT